MPKTVASIELFDFQTDRFVRVGLVKCIHCQAQFEMAPGKTKGRGWCGNCMGYICGPKCLKCGHWEQQLDNIEAGRPENFQPAISSSGWDTTSGGILVPANSE